MFSAHVGNCNEDFHVALCFWGGVDPYRDYPCKSIIYRLMPAFHNGRGIMLKRSGSHIGFAIWGWMTDEEFKTRKYSGQNVFSRTKSDKLVIVDCIITGGPENVRGASREMRSFFSRELPDTTQAYAHRGNREGRFHNSRGKPC